MKDNTLITIVGATAIGKTALSIKLAQHFNSDIISCDSRQFYKEMKIGTAVPDGSELAAATHHFIQNRSIFEDYSVGQFEKDALKKLDELFSKNSIQIMVGGSGLYVDAVLKGLDKFPDVDPEIRLNLTKELDEKGIGFLQKKLKELDQKTFNSIAIDNPQRIIRALEICIGTSKTYSEFKNKPKAPRKFKSILVGLAAEREVLYNRVNKRVDIMIQEGLIDEAKKLHKHKYLNALQTVGYRELFEHFEDVFTKEFAISEIKKNTRRFAKRQRTWFKRYNDVLWFNFQTDTQDIIKQIEERI